MLPALVDTLWGDTLWGDTPSYSQGSDNVIQLFRLLQHSLKELNNDDAELPSTGLRVVSSVNSIQSLSNQESVFVGSSFVGSSFVESSFVQHLSRNCLY